mmetsp:Transcript_8833/g.14689  ORF Transcript_8833/g.14689 Transcript_8833/m.14689 type:complete len:209 (+) Transcript_8833:1716-2342(+)
MTRTFRLMTPTSCRASQNNQSLEPSEALRMTTGPREGLRMTAVPSKVILTTRCHLTKWRKSQQKRTHHPTRTPRRNRRVRKTLTLPSARKAASGKRYKKSSIRLRKKRRALARKEGQRNPEKQKERGYRLRKGKRRFMSRRRQSRRTTKGKTSRMSQPRKFPRRLNRHERQISKSRSRQRLLPRRLTRRQEVSVRRVSETRRLKRRDR